MRPPSLALTYRLTGRLEVILVTSSTTLSVHVYFWSILLVWPAFDRTACSRCPWWLLELSQHLSSWKFCQHYELNLNPYCAFSASGIADLFVESISDCFHLLLQKHIHYLSVYFHLTTFKLVNLTESIYWSVLEIDLFCSLYCTFYACVFFVC